MVQEPFNKNGTNADTAFIMQEQIITDEIEDPVFLEFAIENLDELFSYPRFN